MTLSPHAFFDLSSTEHASLFEGLDFVWEALGRVDGYLESVLAGLGGVGPAGYRRAVPGEGGVHRDAWIIGDVFLAEDVAIEPGAMVQGPTLIGAGSAVRHGAYVRGGCIIGRSCVVGHASELKRVIMLDGSQAPHFNYVGDSILGAHVNLGAGTKLSNLKNDGAPIEIAYEGRRIATRLRKLGAVLGDGVHTGCNSVTSPGTLIGPGTMVYANTVLRGVYPGGSIVKLRQSIEVVPLRRPGGQGG